MKIIDNDYREPDGPYAEDLPDPDGRWLSGVKEIQQQSREPSAIV
jgi:hypothetical protein